MSGSYVVANEITSEFSSRWQSLCHRIAGIWL
jgi:hypothetical protein